MRTPFLAMPRDAPDTGTDKPFNCRSLSGANKRTRTADVLITNHLYRHRDILLVRLDSVPHGCPLGDHWRACVTGVL